MSARNLDAKTEAESASDLMSEADRAESTVAAEQLIAAAQVRAILAAVEHLADIAASLDAIAKRLEFGGGR